MATIRIYESTQSGITWLALSERASFRGLAPIEISKSGRRNVLLEITVAWDVAAKAWHSQKPTGVPKYLWERLARDLVLFDAEPPITRPAPAVTKPAAPRRRFSCATEAIGNGRMSFPSFLAMELVEAYHPDLYRRHTPQGL